MGPLSYAGIRFMAAGLILLPFCGKPAAVIRTVKAHIHTILTVSLFQTFLLYSLFNTGMTLVQGAMGAIVVGASPLFSAIIAHFMMDDDVMTFSKMARILIGLMGVIIISISRQPWTAGGLKELMGIGLLIGGCISSALGNIHVARGIQMNPLILNSTQILIGGCSLFIVSLVVEGFPSFRYPPVFYLALAWMAMISAVAFSIWFHLLKKPGVKVSELNLWKFIIPVFGALFSWMLLPGESPDLISITGMVCVAVSVLSFHLSVIKERNKGIEKNPRKQKI